MNVTMLYLLFMDTILPLNHLKNCHLNDYMILVWIEMLVSNLQIYCKTYRMIDYVRILIWVGYLL